MLTKKQESLLNEYEKIQPQALIQRLEFLRDNDKGLGFIAGDLYSTWRQEAEETIDIEEMLVLEEKVYGLR